MEKFIFCAVNKRYYAEWTNLKFRNSTDFPQYMTYLLKKLKKLKPYHFPYHDNIRTQMFVNWK